jgi:hypothetical protein
VHREGVLHRDLKPDNVLQRHDGTVLLTDFGLARDAAEEHDRLTRTGQVLGTPAYMAPEQASGEVHAIDERTDVYGLGATLYALLTGTPPFSGSSTVNVLSAVLGKRVPAPSKTRPEVGAALDAICLRCLEKDPADRYATAHDLAEALEGALRADPSPRALGQGLLLGSLAILGAGALVGAQLLLQGPPAPPSPPPVSTTSSAPQTTPPPARPPPRWVKRTQEGRTPGPREGHEHACAYAPDRGQFLVLSGHDPNNAREGDVKAQLWGWDGRTWEELGQGSDAAPTWRYGHAAAYDVSRRTLVMFGGATGRGPRADGAWEWSSVKDTWRRVSRVSSGPPWLGWASMVYDPDRRRVIVFGGKDHRSRSTARLWAWDGAGWSLLDDGEHGPRPRHAAGLVYDEHHDELLLFGGWTDSDDDRPHDPTLWRWSEELRWRATEPRGPWPVPAQAASFTATDDGAVLFGGFSRTLGRIQSAGTAPAGRCGSTVAETKAER